MARKGLPMFYHEVVPTGNLAHCVASFWEFTAGPDLPEGYIHAIPVDGCVSITYFRSNKHIPGCSLVGPRLSSLRVPLQKGDQFWGIRLLPGAARSITGRSGLELLDTHGPLYMVSVDLDRDLFQAFSALNAFEEVPAAITQVLKNHMQETSGLNPAIAAGIHEMIRSRGRARIADISPKVGFSERQFLRLFRTEVGLTPKQFSRICRLRAAAIEAVDEAQPSWCRIASEHGYADQSHLVHEFSIFFGMTPTQFEKHFLEQISHGEFRRDV